MKKRKPTKDAPFAVPNWPAAKVEMRALSKIKDYPSNPRTHPESQIDALATLMKKYGPDQPIVVDENSVILKGHGRKQSAIKAGFEEFPVVVHVGLSENDKRAVRISDNQIALLSSWNPELLRLEISELKLAGFDMPLLGFDTFQLAEIMTPQNDEAGDLDEAPEPPKNPIVRVGDLWICGKHRILCGDARVDEDVKRLLDGATPELANCDAPYGISIVKGARAAIGGKPLATDRKHIGNYKLGSVHSPGPDGFNRLGRVHGPAKRAIIAPGLYAPIIGDDTTETAIAAYKTLTELKIPTIVLWGGNYFANALPPSRCWLVWDKEASGTFADAELAWTNQDRVTKLFRHQWNGLMKASERGERRVHPTQKPVALAEWVIEIMEPEAKTVLDLFIGSGSGLIACERKNVQFFGMELAPAYVEASVVRWQAATGKQATLDGRTLEQVAKARRKPTPQAQPATRASKRERAAQAATPS